MPSSTLPHARAPSAAAMNTLHLQWSMAERTAQEVFDAIVRSGTRAMGVEAAYGASPKDPHPRNLPMPRPTPGTPTYETYIGYTHHTSAHASLAFQSHLDSWYTSMRRGLFPFLRTCVATLPALQGNYAHCMLRLEEQANGKAGPLWLHVNGVRVSNDPATFLRKAMVLEQPRAVHSTPGSWVYAADSVQARKLWDIAYA